MAAEMTAIFFFGLVGLVGLVGRAGAGWGGIVTPFSWGHENGVTRGRALRGGCIGWVGGRGLRGRSRCRRARGGVVLFCFCRRRGRCDW